MSGAFVGTRCLPGMQLTGDQAQELCRGTACPGDCAFWASGRTPATTRQTARRHTALFVGDSMARQLYVSTIAWLRGVAHNAATVDFGFQGTTLYLADGSGGEDAVVPLLVPLRCALARLDDAAAEERSECVAARSRALDLTPQLFNSSGKPVITPLIYEMAVSQRRASAAAQRWTDQALAQWAGRASLRLLYVPSNGYVTAFWAALRQVDPHVVFAGALGAHVPCWSDGRAGHRCSIERVAEADHERFWDALLAATRGGGRLRRLVWLTQPVGSPHAGPYARYAGPRYQAWNAAAAAGLRRANLSLAPRVATVLFEYDQLVLRGMRSGAFSPGVLMEPDNVHFTCIAKTAKSLLRLEHYPFEAIDVNHSQLRQVNVSGCCHGGSCEAWACPQPPPVATGCTNKVNAAAARRLAPMVHVE